MSTEGYNGPYIELSRLNDGVTAPEGEVHMKILKKPLSEIWSVFVTVGTYQNRQSDIYEYKGTHGM